MATTIAQKELRNDSGAVLRRVEAGETFTITVAGRPVAELRPIERDTWVGGAALQAVFATAAPNGMMEDIAKMGGELADPWAA